MQMSQREVYIFTFDIQEVRLICKALGGRLKEEDTQAAEALDTQIARSRIAHVEQQYQEMVKLRNNLPDIKEP